MEVKGSIVVFTMLMLWSFCDSLGVVAFMLQRETILTHANSICVQMNVMPSSLRGAFRLNPV